MLLYFMDRDRETRKRYEMILKKLRPDAETRSFPDLASLRQCMEAQLPDAVFLELDAPNSLVFIAEVLRLHPAQNLIAVCKDRNVPCELVSQAVSGAIVKPVAAEAVARQLSRLRHPLQR